MNPADLIPITEPLQVHWLVSDGLLVSTFILHVLLMNILVGGAVIALTYMGKEDGPTGLLSRRLPTILALTINFGVAPLLFLQVNYGHFDYVSSVVMGGWWLAVIPLLIAGYYSFYYFKYRHDVLSNHARPALLLALGCVLYVGFMFSNNMIMMIDPAKWPDYFAASLGQILYMDHLVLYPRFLHFMVAALAVGGLFVALLGKYGRKPDIMHLGLAWFSWATLVNICVGLWFLMALPKDIMFKFMGSNVYATSVLWTGVGFGVLLLIAGFRRYPGLALVLTVSTVSLMAVVRHLLRYLSLEPYYRVQDVTVTGQYSPLYFFLGFLAVGVGLVIYMLGLYAKAQRGA